jgi:hypothetical protein
MNNPKTNTKLFKILNRNVNDKNLYTVDEIQSAFSKENCSSGTQREQEIYFKFFKECQAEELKELYDIFEVNKRCVKKLYNSLSTARKKDFGTFWSTRFRLQKIENGILRRTSEKYKAIDEFKTYELTPCIAYEMAIRNKDVIEIFKKLEKILKMKSDEQYLLHRFLSKQEFKDRYNILDEDLLEKEYKKYEFLVMQKYSTYEKLIEEDYKKFIDDYIDKCTELGIGELETLQKKLEYELVNEYLIYPEGYHRVIPNVPPIVIEKIINKKKPLKSIKYDKHKDDIVYEEIVHEAFIERRGLYANSTKFFVNNITPNFKRQVNDQCQMTIPINLSLPLNEIIEYITIIKVKAKIKSPLEILNGELKKASDLTNMNATDTKGKQFSLDARRGDKPQYKLADMLYIYDMKKNGCTHTQIINKILEKYPNKKNFSDKTIQEYFMIAQDYIDNKKYKELLTGKSALK